MIFVSSDDSSKVVQPSNCSLDLPSLSVPSEFSQVLSRSFFSAPLMRADQFDAPFLESRPQRIAVSSFVVDQPFYFSTECSLVN